MGGKPETVGSLALETNQHNVIVIEAAPRPEARKLRMAAYARVSSDSEDQENSFGAQVRYYTSLISSNENWELSDIYADEGITGTSAEKRADFMRLLADCRRGRVDKVLTKSVSRFARNTRDCLAAIRELKFLGVGVYFEEQNIDTSTMTNELITAFYASLAQSESESISGNMRWSYEERMKSGTFVPSYLPYGYVLENGAIQIQPEQADVVRRIFNSYLAGDSTDVIANTLREENVPCKSGKTNWGATTIRSILSNEKYLGNSLWKKYYTTDTVPYKCVLNKGERTQYYVEGTHPAIITHEIFQAAQVLKEKRASQITTGMATAAPLQGKLYCGKCGTRCRKKIARGTTYWVCRTHFVDTNACFVPQINENDIYAAFLRIYYKLKHYGPAIFRNLIAQLQSIREKRMLWSVEIIELNNRIYEISSQNHVLAEARKCAGDSDPDFFIAQAALLTEQLRAAKLEKERLLNTTDDDTNPRTQEILETLESAPDTLSTFDESWFDELIEKITVESRTQLCFHLKNGLILTEYIARVVQ